MSFYESAAKAQQETVDDAYRLLGTRKHGVGCFPTFLLLCLENRVWESEREDASGKPVAPCSFHDFIHKPYPDGLDSSYDAIESIIRSEPKLVAEWQRISGRTIDKAPVSLPVDSIRADGGTQSRAAVDEAVVADYQEHLKSLPPVVAFYDGSDYWLADGFHRLEAHKRASCECITADVRQGTRRDAVLFSVGANAAHGLRRTNADKRRAVELLLGDSEWSKKSDRWIASRCGVHPETVGTYRKASSESDNARPTSRLTQDGRQYPSERKLPERRPQPSEPAVEAAPPPVDSAAPEPSDAREEPPRMRQMTIDDRLADARVVETSSTPFRPQPNPPLPLEQPVSGPSLAQVHRLEGLEFNEARRAVQRLCDGQWAQLVDLENERRGRASNGGVV